MKASIPRSYDFGSKPPHGRAWDHYIRVPRVFTGGGPFLAPKIDEEDWEFIEHVRATGRLPGAGALQCWNMFDHRTPIIEPQDDVYVAYRRTRAKAPMADVIATRELAMAKENARLAAIAEKTKADKAVLERTKKEIRAEDRKRRKAIVERARRWEDEQEEWDRSAAKSQRAMQARLEHNNNILTMIRQRAYNRCVELGYSRAQTDVIVARVMRAAEHQLSRREAERLLDEVGL